SPQLWRKLTWTSIGGTANDIRCAHSDIVDDTTFNAAWQVSYGMNQSLIDSNHPYGTLVASEPSPKANGQADSFTLVGLQPNMTYYCAMKTDGGALSNSTTFATAKYAGYGYQSLGGGEKTICQVNDISDVSSGASNVGTLRYCLGLGANHYILFSVG